MSQGNRHNRTRAIRIIEVGPRDGLQNERGMVLTEDKVSFVNALSCSGVAEIEIGSFVSPDAIPQLADSDEVFRKIERRPGVTYSALVPNMRGLERAKAVEIQKISVFTAASETFAQHNIKCGVRESIDRFAPVVNEAHQDAMTVRAYISTVTHCPFEGPVDPSRVSEVMHRLLQIGVDEISLGDTIGKATPNDVRRLLDEILPHIQRSRLSLHLHDTYGMAVANVLAAWTEYDIEAFDTAAGGLGGCPYAPGASGNVATEDAVYALKASGAPVPVDEQRIIAAALGIGKVLNHPLSSRLSRIQIERTRKRESRDHAGVMNLAEQVRAGSVRAISRLITRLENGDQEGSAALHLLVSAPSRAAIIGITGYPGAGKSTVVTQLVTAYRRLGLKVGVLAVDISSPVTGGALLGDRIRMQEHILDRDVYIRSMASRGQHGGLSRATNDAASVLKAAGYEVILIETVGVGQNEIDVVDSADTVVAVVAPGLGDEVQTMKAGLLEVADIIVVNKADLAGAETALRDLQDCYPAVLQTIATTGEGIPGLVEAISEHQRSLKKNDNGVYLPAPMTRGAP